MNLEKLYESIGLPQELVEAYSGETIPEDTTLLDSYNKSRFAFYKANPEYKVNEENERSKTYVGTTQKIVKILKNEFGMEFPNSNIDTIQDIKDFLPTLKAHIDTNSKTTSEISEWKNKVAKVTTEKSELAELIEQMKIEQEMKIKTVTNQIMAESYWSKMLTNDTELNTLDVKGKAFTLEAIKRSIFEQASIDGNGNILSKDGTAFMHPNGKRVIDKVDELFAYYKDQAGLVKVSNAGVGLKPGEVGGGMQPSAALQAAMDRIASIR